MSRRIDHRWRITTRRQRFVDLRWKAATSGSGFVLTRETRLWGAIYMLLPLNGTAQILYSLDEVEQYLDRHTTATP
ncbi:hypothetical protein NE857_26240 [Nocardiopsis exhalans]|uniref:Uncharacterized protein n=1 Tax=Nocardiopsis exhalans TaxID=163604 RepID=A0ABY5D2Z7_9ACTN|nr:hypothetical protein [Nocardiopsis exhalans]USY18752.1 hypothetical protein NE857_26240 [Nocardiopsis exhalans]